MQPDPIEPPLNFFDPYYVAWHLPLMFVLGALMGSFFNVCIYRIPMGVLLTFPGSHCYRCGTPIRWFDNIPLVSYWLLGGRCRDCGVGFSPRYFFIELLTALLFTGLAWRFGYSLALIPALVFVSLLLIATFTDLDHYIIPLRISVGGVAIGLALAAVWPLGLAEGNPLAEPLLPVPRWLGPLSSAALGAAAGFVSLGAVGLLGSIAFRKPAMGMGDVYLFAMFGAFCGPLPLLSILLLACAFGLVLGLTGIVLGKLREGSEPPEVDGPDIAPSEAVRYVESQPITPVERLVLLGALLRPGRTGPGRHYMPFGPSLALAAGLVYVFGGEISDFVQQWLFGPPWLG